MNNNISGDLANYMSSRANHMPKETAKEVQKLQNDDEVCQSGSYEVAQKCCGALGHAKVSMDNGLSARVADSVKKFTQDPEHVEMYNDLCDALKKEGYSLEDAVIGTDIIFENLKDGSTYKP